MTPLKRWRLASFIAIILLIVLTLAGTLSALPEWAMIAAIAVAGLIVLRTVVLTFSRADEHRQKAKSLRDILLKRRWEERQRREW